MDTKGLTEEKNRRVQGFNVILFVYFRRYFRRSSADFTYTGLIQCLIYSASIGRFFLFSKNCTPSLIGLRRLVSRACLSYPCSTPLLFLQVERRISCCSDLRSTARLSWRQWLQS